MFKQFILLFIALSTCFAHADLDGDGDLDLLTGGYYGDFQYF